MDLEPLPPLGDSFKCCSCSCCCLTWNGSLKRKFGQINESDDRSNYSSVARVEIKNECVALREAVTSQQQTLQVLCTELEEERNASASAVNETMSMILRLQREKAEIQMEARQFKRFTDEKMAYDQQELFMLEDLLYKREQIIHSLTCEVQAHKHRLMSFGYTESEAEGMIIGAGVGSHVGRQNVGENQEMQFDYPPFDYPRLKCNLNEAPVLPVLGNDAPSDLDKYAFGETPNSREHLQDLEFRIHLLERSSSSNQIAGEYVTTKNFIEKAIVGQSPQWPRHARRNSTESSSSLMGMVNETGYEDCPLPKVDNASDIGDDMSNRIYTIDSVEGVPCNGETKTNIGICTDYVATTRESLAKFEMGETDIEKLCIRLQALEVDRESMRQEVILMQTNKAHLMLMKEMSQLLCKKMSPENQVSVKKMSLLWRFSFMSVLKSIVSFVFWRRKAHRIKYVFESSSNNLGLLLLLEKSPCMMGQWRCLTRASIS